MNQNLYILSLITLAIWSQPKLALAQIVPAANDAGSQVQASPTTPNQLDITGGTQAGQNLFHGFQQFDVGLGQIVNFRSQPTIQNILSRVGSSNPSTIDGLIQVTGGNSNLFLINPAGIIFGANARLQVPAAFTATTANAIAIGNGWFNAAGNNNYSQLGGQPSQVAFTTLVSGAIVNAGNLTVGTGQSLMLLGGTVINTGTITAPGGTVTIAAVPGENLVRISEPGNLLSLALPLAAKAAINPAIGSPVSLPELLTGGRLGNATDMTVKAGVVTLTGSGVQIPQQPGVAVVTNQVDVSGAIGGRVDVLGQTVGVVDAQINASGRNGGGQVRIGGDYQGKGSVPNAMRTVVNANSQIQADAIVQGNGGRVIVWADDITSFTGKISVRGGSQSGNGGLVEVSGKQNLVYNGTVDRQAPQGNSGQLLLDPSSVIIGTATTNDNQLSDRQILAGDGGNSIFSISGTALRAALDLGTVSIAASNNITISSNFSSSFITNTFGLTLSAPNIVVNNGIFFDLKGDLNLQGQTIDFQPNSSIVAGGNLTLNATTQFTAKSADMRSGNDLNLQSPAMSLQNSSVLKAGRDLTITGQSLKIQDDFQANGSGAVIVQSGRNLLVQGDQNITLQAAKNPASVFQSGNDLTLASNGLIVANAKFVSGGNFDTRRVADANPATVQITAPNFNSLISATGDVTFGNYEGLSLKVEAKGSITGGNIKILGPNATLSGADPDIAPLKTRPALILKAGVSALTNAPNTPQSSGGAAFTASAAPSVGKITVGDIQITDPPSPTDTTLPGVLLMASSGITTGDISARRQSIKLSTATGNLTTGALFNSGLVADQNVSVTLNAPAGNVTVQTIDTGAGGLDVTALGTFQALASANFSGGTFQNESLIVKDNPALIDFLVANVPGVTRAQLIASNTRIDVDTTDFPVSIIARPTNIDDPNNARIVIRHGGVAVGNVGDRIQVQGNGDPIGFQSGPTVTRQGLGFEALNGNVSDFDRNSPTQTFTLRRTELYQPLSGLSSTTTGAVGGIVVGAGSNTNLYAAFRDRAFDAPPPKPNPGGGNNGGGSSGGEGGNEGNTPSGGTRGSSSIATVDRQRNQATCATAPTLAAIPTDETRAAKAPSAGCQPLGDDAPILKILQEPTSQNPSEALSQTLAQHHQTAQQQRSSLVFNQAPPEAFAPQLRR